MSSGDCESLSASKMMELLTDEQRVGRIVSML